MKGKNMKKILALLLTAFIFIGLFTSCDNFNDTNITKPTEEQNEETNENSCNHKGGVATCKSKALCELCNSFYGDINPNNHLIEKTWQKTTTTHKQIYPCCGATLLATEIHEWNQGKCSICEYSCIHKDSTGDSNHLCDTCATSTGECIDINRDHVCDECGTSVGIHADADNDLNHICDYCGINISICIDSNKDHTCDECGAFLGIHGDALNDGDHICEHCGIIMTNCLDIDKNHICDECESNVGAHTDKLGDNKHECEYCGNFAGECFDTDKNHSCDECLQPMGEHKDAVNDGNHKCDYCNENLTQCVDENQDRICDECNEIFYSTGFVFNKNSDNQGYTIVGIGNCRDSNIVIPRFYNNLPITKIAASAFANCDFITSITIHDNIKSIETDAFYGCLNIDYVYADDLISWANIDFSNQYSTPVFFAEKLYIKNSDGIYQTFTELVINSDFKNIKSYAFAYLTSLNSVTFKTDSLDIEVFAFDDSCNIKTVCVEKLEDWCNITFGNAQSNPVLYSKTLSVKNSTGTYEEIVDLVIPDSITEINAFTFAYLEKIKTIDLNNTVSINDYAFSECFNVKDVIIPNSVKNIAKGIFCETYIEKLTFTSQENINIHENAFELMYSLKSIIVSANVFSYIKPSSTIKNINITGGDLKNRVFYGFSGVEYLTIGETVTNLNCNVLVNTLQSTPCCPNLKSIVVDENNPECKSIDGNLYSKDGTKLIQYALGKEDTTFIIPDGVTQVGSFAFCGAKNLKSIVIPESVKLFGYCSFTGCIVLESVEFKNPEGWNYCSTPISSSDLSNKSTAAKLVRQNYEGWQRTED